MAELQQVPDSVPPRNSLGADRNRGGYAPPGVVRLACYGGGMRTPLPVFGPELCDDCGGRCCRHIGLPPFDVANPDLGPEPVPAGQRLGDYTDAYVEMIVTDLDTFARMPAALRAEHAAMLRALKADPTGTPCAWLTPEGRCRHYDYRPATCRVWEPTSKGCLGVRASDTAQVVWRTDTRPGAWRNPRRGYRTNENTPWRQAERRVRRWMGGNKITPHTTADRDRLTWWVLGVWVAALLTVAPTVRAFRRRGWQGVRDVWEK